jgi:hypothetical protein
MGTGSDSIEQKPHALDDEGAAAGVDVAAGGAEPPPTPVVELTEGKGPHRRFYANLADL